VSKIRVVISLYSLLLISRFLLLFSLVDVGHIDRTTLNTSVLSFSSLLAYISYLFNPYL